MESTTLAPPGPDVSKASLVVGTISFLHLISWTLYAARIWTRMRPISRLFVDDYLITLAVLFDLASYIFLMIAVHYGIGRHNYYVPTDQEVLAEKWLFLSQPVFPWSLAFSKMSIACMLIRIRRDQRVWAWGMYFIMAFVVLIAINTNAFQLSLCRPLWAVWDHSNSEAQCMDMTVAQTSIYVNSALNVVTDFALSLAPITFIVHLQRPLREKIAVAFMMGLGIFASSACIAKTFHVKDYGKTGDSLMDCVPITIWSMVEMQLAIIASCIPCLKQLFERGLRRFGLLSTQDAGDSFTGSRNYQTYPGPNFRTRQETSDDYGHHLTSIQQSPRSPRSNKAARNSGVGAESIESSEIPIMRPDSTGTDYIQTQSAPPGRGSFYFNFAVNPGLNPNQRDDRGPRPERW
ncbi:hypothetical protein QC762_121420 [Podospora pseudocomata]|uniref:Rhodopsin domain-containing protein n=1 Tax=Podospora pseudocomata TaxID=2093779 RepID=A0ABR0GY85_9PEZI|nr:hypothetical protein QC762_121420 [Podospora pseudocomata]